VERMINTIRHRGPDSTGRFSHGKCVLGHARLSILDLETGNQPMSDSTGRFWTVLNGEIYNHRELREELIASGYDFRTSSDTEVITVAYAKWGDECLDHLRGMFAFAIWDSVTESLFAARDLFGEKPLYYSSLPDGGLLLASELKGLLASKVLQPSFDTTSLDAYLLLGYVPPERTAYTEIEALPPAHWMRWSEEGLTIQRYWTPICSSRQLTLGEAAEQLRYLLRRSVRRQMVADVEVGAFLSGGVDSSTIVALMCEERGAERPVQTFSLGFEKLPNELPFARLVANRFGTAHHEIAIGDIDLAELVEKMVGVYDEPFADTSAIATYLVSQHASKYVKAVLTGDGGDELFGGYNHYSTILAAGKIPAAPLSSLLLRILGRIFRRSLRLRKARSAAALAVSSADPWIQCMRAHSMFSAAERRLLWRDGGPEILYDPVQRSPSVEVVQGLQRALHFDLTSYLSGDILVKVDRAAMAHGLETRAPLLDRDVVEFALSLPINLKLSESEGKLVFRHAFREFWPEEIAARSKMGFDVNLRPWMNQPGIRHAFERIFAPGSALLRHLPGASLPGETSSGRAWRLFMLGVWLEAHENDAG
jgi:asparagine synthase (glutamine-hydrolysing)